jgi:hypothetical protein
MRLATARATESKIERGGKPLDSRSDLVEHRPSVINRCKLNAGDRKALGEIRLRSRIGRE